MKMDLLPDLENIRSKGFRSPKNRSDQNFMSGTGHSFFHAIYCNCFSESNSRENYDAIYCTLALLIVEVGYDENTLLEIFKLLLAIQEEIRDRTSGANKGSHVHYEFLFNNWFNKLAKKLVQKWLALVLVPTFSVVFRVFLFVFCIETKFLKQVWF